jgi:predicted nucleic acid-binding protein
VDTSAFLAVLDASDRFHARAREIWEELIQRGERLLCTSYVLVETDALGQSRLGLDAVRDFTEDVVPLLHVYWVTEADHRAAVTALLTAGRRQLSLVDCTSFLVMRQLHIETAFAFDDDFSTQGFQTLG